MQQRIYPAHPRHGGRRAGRRRVSTPFDILPAVWLASAVSVTVGILSAKLLPDWESGRNGTVFFSSDPAVAGRAAVFALGRRVNVYDALTAGPMEGLRVMARILLALIGLLSAVWMLRSFRCAGAGSVRTGAAAAADRSTGGNGSAHADPSHQRQRRAAVGSELIARYGPDSLIGRTPAVMLGSSETTFYTIAVYFGGIGIVRTRHAVPALTWPVF